MSAQPLDVPARPLAIVSCYQVRLQWRGFLAFDEVARGAETDGNVYHAGNVPAGICVCLRPVTLRPPCEETENMAEVLRGLPVFRPRLITTKYYCKDCRSSKRTRPKRLKARASIVSARSR